MEKPLAWVLSRSRFSRIPSHAAPIEERLQFGLCYAPAGAPAEGNPDEVPISQPAAHRLHVDLQPLCNLIDCQHTLIHRPTSSGHCITPYHDNHWSSNSMRLINVR